MKKIFTQHTFHRLLIARNLKRTLLLVLVSLTGYYCMFYNAGPAQNGEAVTGAPFNGNTTCTSCHSGGNFGATIVLQLLDASSNVVTTYNTGQSYTVRMTRTANTTYNNIANAGFGFQLTCATGASNTNFNGWGTLPSNTANRNLSSRNYIEHTTKLSKTITQLNFPWTAPSSASAGTANFYIALNSVNGDGSDAGDQGSNTSLSIPAACPTPTVSISASATTICSGTNVTFTATPTNGGTTPTYQWKINGTNVTGATNSTFSSTTLSSGNQVTVVMTPTSPCNTSSATSNTVTMTVNTSVTPSVSISATSSTICSGSSVTFTATPTNGGTTPTYQWKKNGTAVTGATLSTFTTTTLVNTDAITVTMTSNASCVTTSTATSNSIAMTVNANVTPSVSIAATASTICAGTSVTFTATPTNGGTTPAYQWKKNGTAVSGATNATFTSSSLANNDVITVVLTSNATCATTTTATSNSITMTVNANVTPSVAIAATSSTICAGTSVTFTATPTNGGSTPTYQWKNNGNNISGATNATYSSTSLSNGDVITVDLTSNATCVTTNSASSNAVTMTVSPIVTPSVSIAASSNNVCAGTSITFTATPVNGGSTPTYQWKNNGNIISGATNATFTSSSLNNGNIISLVMTSSATCATSQTVTSNSINMSININVTPVATISASSNSICAGGSASFTSNILNGGTSTTYQWMLNGNAISGETNSTFSSNNLANSDIVSLSITSNVACATTTTANSNSINMTVNPIVSPTVSIATGSTTVCPSTAVTFSSSVTNGGTSPQYQWKRNGGIIPGASSSSYTANGVNDNDVFSVNVTSNAVCLLTSNAVSNNITMSLLAPVSVITPSGSTALCSGGNVTLTANSGSSYLWSNGATTQSITVSTAGNYTVAVTGVGGCSSSSSPVSVQTLPATVKITSPGLLTVCDPTTVVFMADPAMGSVNNFNYQWNLNTSAISGATGLTYTASGASTGAITLTLSGATCSKTSMPKTYTIKTLPVASFTAGSATTFCLGSSVSLTAPALTGYTYTWLNNNISAGAGNPKVIKTSGVYSVVAKLNGCLDTSSSSVTVIVNPLPTASISNLTPNIFCAGDSCLLAALPSGGNSYSWMIGTATAATTTLNTHAVYNGATFKVIVTDSNGCVSKASATSVKTTANAIPVASISAATSTTISATGSVKLNASPTAGVTFQWFKNGVAIASATTKSYVATTGGSYTVAITKSGCTGMSSATEVIQLSPKESQNIINEEFSLTSYPNPVNNSVTISVAGIESTEANIEMMDYNGRLMGIWSISNGNLSIDMSKFSSGVYLARYKDVAGRTSTIKLIKE